MIKHDNYFSNFFLATSLPSVFIKNQNCLWSIIEIIFLCWINLFWILYFLCLALMGYKAGSLTNKLQKAEAKKTQEFFT